MLWAFGFFGASRRRPLPNDKSQRLPLGWRRSRRGKDAENVDGFIHRHSEPFPLLVAFFGYEKQKNRNTSRSRANKTMLEDRCRYWDRHCLSLLTERNIKKYVVRIDCRFFFSDHKAKRKSLAKRNAIGEFRPLRRATRGSAS